MRLFAGVVPPGGVVAELAREVERLRDLPGAENLRWTGRAGWHFTLAFYGEVPDELVPELERRLHRAAHRHPPFDLRLSGGGRFARAVVWVGADGDPEAMRRLADSAEAGARRAGVSMAEHRRYTPHLTVARARRPHQSLRPYADALAGFESSPWTVDELLLIRSHLPKGGVEKEQPRYETVGRWKLRT
ncbi:RNA 2',3'-cyclic phosphodiesterase [Streptomyces pathocidini]|uniref:RNA 2',3'-cyclic phosphodiesterase n=1 Tax=Streptomyces pathocidini TaxID=1650571 RepID=UPI00340F3F2D